MALKTGLVLTFCSVPLQCVLNLSINSEIFVRPLSTMGVQLVEVQAPVQFHIKASRLQSSTINVGIMTQPVARRRNVFNSLWECC